MVLGILVARVLRNRQLIKEMKQDLRSGDGRVFSRDH